MESKSFTFTTLLLCAILAQTFASKVITEADKADSKHASDESIISGVRGLDDDVDDNDDEYDYVYPSLSCLLFRNIGCNSQCSVVGSAFGYQATGTCDELDICDCTVARQGKETLDSLWNAKFDAKHILQLLKNKNLSEVVFDILQEPFQTTQEIKKKLQPFLTKDQLKKLKAKKIGTVAEKTTKDKLYSTDMKNYISERFAKALNTADSKTLYAAKYNSILLEELKKADAESKENPDNNAFNELAYNVLRTRNKTLNDIFTKYLTEKKLKIDEEESEPTVADIIVGNVIDEMVKRVDENASTAVQEPEEDADDDTDTSDVLEEGRFVLPNMDKNIFKQPGPVDRTLNRSTHKLRYQKSSGGDIKVFWAKGKDEVNLQKTAATGCNHTWKFKDVAITISKTPGGDIDEFWNFGESTYKYSKSTGGDVHSEWSGEKPHTTMLKKYREFIDVWCRDNDYILENRYCVIYNH